MTSITFISDTHNQASSLRLEPGDILCHTGDMTNFGTGPELKYFEDWFASQTQFKHKICIAGNHDKGLDYRNGKTPFKFTDSSITYLCDQAVELEGIKFYGTPWVNEYGPWAFGLHSYELYYRFGLIPDNTQVLLTHTPPKKILDYCPEQDIYIGSEELLDVVKLRPNLVCHAFGHCHEHSGRYLGAHDITFINSSNGNTQTIFL